MTPENDPERVFVADLVGRFGASADGLSDDGPALAEALIAARRQGATAIVLEPPRVYRLAKPLHIPPGLRIIGAGGRRGVHGE